MNTVQNPIVAALGPAFADLPNALQKLHSGTDVRRYSGRTVVRHGPSVIARILLRLGGFPPQGSGLPLRFTITPDAQGEAWARDFDGHVTQSRLRTGKAGQVIERFGPFHITMQPVATPTSLSFPVVAIHCLGFALPRRMLPKNPSYESVDASGAVIFDIGAELPVLGPLIGYRGTLRPQACDAESATPALSAPTT
jgi:hypothetical protein